MSLRFRATPEAEEVTEHIREETAGELGFVFGGGCCDGTAPFLFRDPLVGPRDEQVGEIGSVPLYASERFRGLYEDVELVVDVVASSSDALSLETDLGRRFVLRTDAVLSRSPEERA